jgi:hypothetical protein
MDCEKMESLLLDELYEELDEVTSAAVKRHVSGCSRCASILHGMRATRRLAALPMEEVPAGLEDRIMAAAKDAQKVVPLHARGGGARLSRAISVAGRWAMRPQTAMAAVFLLMIGTTTFVIRSNHIRRSADAVSVTEEGTPQAEPASEGADPSSLNSPAAATAHGAAAPKVAVAPPVAASAAAMAANATPAATQAPEIVAANDGAGPMDRLTKGAARDKDDEALGSGLALEDALAGKAERKRGEGMAAPVAPSPAPAAKPKAFARSGPGGGDGISNAGVPGGAPVSGGYAQSAPPPPPSQSQRRASDPQDAFSAGMAAYRTRSFAEATRQFDAAARSGDRNAALWAARSVKEGTGCSAALGRLGAIAQQGAGSWVGNEASLEAARCEMQMGQLDAARSKLQALAKTTSHAQKAQAALAELDRVASKKGGGSAATGAAAERHKAAAPAPARLAPPPAKSTDEKSNTQSGF